MPEMRFVIAWPDGRKETCYSPSLVIKDYFAEGRSYPLSDFLDRSRTALTIAKSNNSDAMLKLLQDAAGKSG